MTTYVVDVDGTLCGPKPDGGYIDCEPNVDVIKSVNDAYDLGYHIIIFTARGMRTYNKSIADIEANVKPVLEKWLHKHGVKYHELLLGKPWGSEVYYIDDRAIRPDEFVKLIRSKNDNSNYPSGWAS